MFGLEVVQLAFFCFIGWAKQRRSVRYCLIGKHVHVYSSRIGRIGLGTFVVFSFRLGKAQKRCSDLRMILGNRNCTVASSW